MAFALSVALFSYFWIVGYPLVSVLHTRRDLIRNALLAPAAGIAVTVYAIYALNRAGLPVKSFAVVLAASIVVVAAASWALLRPLLAGRRLLPYLAVLLVAFLATGWPLLSDGFAWLGDVNTDMTFYVLNAHRLVDQGFLQAPDPEVWRSQSDRSAYLFQFQFLGVRSGAELLLAWVIAMTGLNGLQVYMAVLVALNAAVITVASGLVPTAARVARLASAALLAVSAMLTMGVTLELIAQVLGLILLAGGVSLCLAPFYRLRRDALLRHGVLTSLFLAAFYLCYPEMLPFLGLAFLLHHGANLGEVIRSRLAFLISLIAMGALSVALVAPDVLGFAYFLLWQVAAGTTAMRYAALFPYFLIPSGLAAVWGLAEYIPLSNAVLSVATGAGGLLTIAAAWASVRLVANRQPSAAVLCGMLGLAVIMFMTDNGFGLLKLAMYVQPFLLTTAVLGFLVLTRRLPPAARAALAVAGLMLLAAPNALTQYRYVSRSAAYKEQHSVMLQRLRQIQAPGQHGPVLLDSQQQGLENIMALYARGRPSASFGDDHYSGSLTLRATGPPLRSPALAASMRQLTVEVLDSYRHFEFPLAPYSAGTHKFIRAELAGAGAADRHGTIVTAAADATVLNSSAQRPGFGTYYVTDMVELRNYLVQVGATHATKIVPGHPDEVGMWPFEPDRLLGTRGMQAVGRHILLEVLNPAPNSRVLLDFTTGAGLNGQRDLSRAMVIGENASSFGLVDEGASRVLSQPVTPHEIAGRFYLAIDLMSEPQHFTHERHGFLALYNRHLGLDPRRLTGFVRNISLLTAEEAESLNPPSKVHIPKDLTLPGLLFSGLYEDGWMSHAARIRLAAEQGSSSVRLTGHLPGIQGLSSGASIELRVDGDVAARRDVEPGDFELEIPVTAAAGPRWIEIRSSATATLPPPDGRSVSLRIKTVELGRTGEPPDYRAQR